MDLYQRITDQVDDLRQDQIREMGLVNADGLPSTEALVDQIIFNDHSDFRSKRKPEEKFLRDLQLSNKRLAVQALDKNLVMKKTVKDYAESRGRRAGD